MFDAFGVSGAVNSEFRPRVPTLIFFTPFSFTPLYKFARKTIQDFLDGRNYSPCIFYLLEESGRKF